MVVHQQLVIMIREELVWFGAVSPLEDQQIVIMEDVSANQDIVTMELEDVSSVMIFFLFKASGRFLGYVGADLICLHLDIFISRFSFDVDVCAKAL